MKVSEIRVIDVDYYCWKHGLTATKGCEACTATTKLPDYSFDKISFIDESFGAYYDFSDDSLMLRGKPGLPWEEAMDASMGLAGKFRKPFPVKIRSINL